MTVIAVTSARSSPGVTSLAYGISLAWKQQSIPPLLVEADPRGGVLGLRFDLSAEPSLVTLGADMRRGFDPRLVHNNAIDLHGIECLLAPTDPLVATRTLEGSARILADELPSFELETVIDLGRIFDRSPALPLARCADRVLIVARPRVDEAQSLLFAVRLLKAHDCDVALVTIGDGPYQPEEICELAEVPLAGVIPDDRALASALTGGLYSARRLKRSLLWRSINAIAHALVQERDEGATPKGENDIPETDSLDAPADPSPADLKLPPPPIDADRVAELEADLEPGFEIKVEHPNR